MSTNGTRTIIPLIFRANAGKVPTAILPIVRPSFEGSLILGRQNYVLHSNKVNVVSLVANASMLMVRLS